MCEQCGDPKCFGSTKFNLPHGSAERAIDLAYVMISNARDVDSARKIIQLVAAIYGLPLTSVGDMIKARHDWYGDRHKKGLGVPDYYAELKDLV